MAEILEKVDSWEEVVENFQNFNSSLDLPDSIATERLHRFFHWYYHPSLRIFAPSKFLGYKQMTHFRYTGDGSGSETQSALRKYFQKHERGTNEYRRLLNQLEAFLHRYGKKVSIKTLEGSGGIYSPKEKYSSELVYDQIALSKVTRDIDGIIDEYESNFVEGEKKKRLVSYYERIPVLRLKAIEIHGLACKVCTTNFEEKYGEHGKDYIEVHHIVPLAQRIRPESIDPRTDFTVLCSNCHRMIHRKRNSPLTVDELKLIVKSRMS